jgi:hypothetical protein
MRNREFTISEYIRIALQWRLRLCQNPAGHFPRRACMATTGGRLVWSSGTEDFRGLSAGTECGGTGPLRKHCRFADFDINADSGVMSLVEMRPAVKYLRSLGPQAKK